MIRSIALAAVVVGMATTPAYAEGSLQLGPNQGLSAETRLGVDIADEVSESVRWSGTGSLRIYAPGSDPEVDAPVATLSSGEVFSPTARGEHPARVSVDQIAGTSWDIAVLDGPTELGGRVLSRRWVLQGLGLAEVSSSNLSFFVRVPGGSVDQFGVVEVRHVGVSSETWTFVASAAGVNGAGRSASTTPMVALDADQRAYLQTPSAIVPVVTTPVLTEVLFEAGTLGCNLVAPGATTGDATFMSNVLGRAHLICDMDADGTFSRTDPDDAVVSIDTVVGPNAINWDGRDATGAAYPFGEYGCVVELAVGETHAVHLDAETAFDGVRMFGASGGLRMFWDDAAVQANAVMMPNGRTSPVASPVGGLFAGPPGDAAAEGVNARGWGDFGPTGASKGNDAWLDTFAALVAVRSARFEVTLIDPLEDGDLDGIPTIRETCELCTDATLRDSDADTIDDFIETNGGTASVDTDMDLICDALDEDSDADCVDDIDDGTDHTDMDGIADWRDNDNDDDLILGCVEVADALLHGVNIDGDGIPCYDDPDSDGDGKSDLLEGVLDIDLDGIPNYKDPNDCGDAIIDALEGCDDGNRTPNDGCSATCAVEDGYTCTSEPSTCETRCGDGIIAGAEVCDDGAMNSDTVADACRRDCRPARCGDSVRDTPEACDEGPMNSTAPGALCRPGCLAAGCGDGVMDPGEACDRGALNSDTLADACRTSCTLAGCGDGVVDMMELCDRGDMNSDTVANACRSTCLPAFCGDSVTDTGEDCDEGDDNSEEPDALCRPGCAAAGCGDGVIDAGEACDEGDDNSDIESGACRTACELPSCGDGVIDPGEGCDEGDENSDDPRATCRTNCAPSGCGDGIVQAGETCDEGERNSDAPNAACRITCVLASCGDGILDTAREACDDGGANSDTAPDRCRRRCELPSCGDGVTDRGEACDDGGASSMCTAMCTEEIGMPDAGTDAGIDAGGDGGADAEPGRGGPVGGSCSVGHRDGTTGLGGFAVFALAGLVMLRRRLR